MTLESLHPYFIGPYGENANLLEELVVEFVRDHVYWRRNFHPESTPPIPTTAQYRPDYLEFVADLKRELYRLSADLKKSVPFFSPRYVGHMASDLLLPGVIAKIVTTLYNPNNVSEDASPATLQKELEVGMQLARMVGYPTSGEPAAWGHLTSGGTVANYTALRNLIALKLFPLALLEAARAQGVDFENVGPNNKRLSACSEWELLNLTVDEIIELRRQCLGDLRRRFDRSTCDTFAAALTAERFEHLGAVGFFRKHSNVNEPVVLVSTAGHYSWEKGMKVLGLGTANLLELRADRNMRLDIEDLRATLDRCLADRRPVLAVVSILGNTEFGTVDPLGKIVEVRREFDRRGLHAPLHVDAAWGGYLATMFQRPDGQLHERAELESRFRYFPSQTVYDAFASLRESDSITIDPHKLGYIPYAAGAFVARNGGVIDFVSQSAAYVFDVAEGGEEPPLAQRMRHLGQYILEGSKPGAAAAAAYLTHKVLPLHSEGFGKILQETIRASEYFFDALESFADRVADRVVVTVPIEPDTNLACIAINPRDNTSLARMNEFGRLLFEHLSIDPNLPVQHLEFVVSYTSLLASKLAPARADEVLSALGIDPHTFTRHPGEHSSEADHIFLLRHTLMNPWLLFEEDGLNYIDRYLDCLERVIDAHLEQSHHRMRRTTLPGPRPMRVPR